VHPLMRLMGRFGPPFVILALQGTLLSASNVAPTQGAPAPETPFVTGLVEPIGVTATTAFGYATHIRCTSAANPNREVVSFDSTGSKKVIATFVPGEGTPACEELYIAVAPGPPDNTAAAGYPTKNPAGFTSNELYVAERADISVIRLKKNPNGSVAFNPDGSYQFQAPAPFKHLFPCGGTRTGITFDETTAGAFGNRLIVTCETGEVWLLNADGTTSTAAPFANIASQEEVSGPFEGPAVATEGPFAGNLLVAAENSSTFFCFTHLPSRLIQAAFLSQAVVCPPGEVFKVTPAGAVSPVADVPSAESVTVARTTKCTLGLTNGFTYFTAIFKPAGAAGPGGTIDQLPRSAFSGLAGNAFVTSENGETGIGIAQVSGTNTVTNFRNFFKEHQGSNFADCLVPVLVNINVIRGSTGITVQIPSNKNFFSGNLIQSTVRFGPYTTGQDNAPPTGQCTLATSQQGNQNQGGNAQGNTDQQNAAEGISTCHFPNNLAPGQLGVIKFKFNDPAGPGDGDAEGGGG